jgi:hypothetical protein
MTFRKGEVSVRKHLISAAALAAMTLLHAPAAAAPVPAVDDADGRALILVPLTLVKIDDLDFGSLIRSSASGTVTIDPSTGARSVTGGVTEVAGDPGNRAYFAGAGSPDQQVLLAISPPVELTSAAGDTIPVVGLTLDGPANRTIDPVTRAFYVGVGGTLQIAADQPEGDYNADFWLTAIYQ